MSSAPPQQNNTPKLPPLSNWPTIKIFIQNPKESSLSRKTDEWCLVFSRQTVGGRARGEQPYTRMIGFRHVFPHEVRNVPWYKKHANADADGNAQYPLPPEGQPKELRNSPAGPSDNKDPSTRYWQEGWYLRMGNSRTAATEILSLMSYDLKKQHSFTGAKEHRKRSWAEYLERREVDKDVTMPVEPYRPWPDTSNNLLLAPLSMQIPSLWDRMNKVLDPTRHALEITRKSIESGEHSKFARRVWEKAGTDEPFVLAKRAMSCAYKRWKDRDITDESDDSKKGSKP